MHCTRQYTVFGGKEKRKVNKKDFNTKMANTDFAFVDGPRENVFFFVGQTSEKVYKVRRSQEKCIKYLLVDLRKQFDLDFDNLSRIKF